MILVFFFICLVQLCVLSYYTDHVKFERLFNCYIFMRKVLKFIILCIYAWWKIEKHLFPYFQAILCSKYKEKLNFMTPFCRWGLMLQVYKATMRRQSFDRPKNDERLSWPWSYPVVLNTGPLKWESSALTIRPMLQIH